ncbi:MAG TPA: response regulator [Anaerolineales bacterium]|nr:response regulator [Anaerolineales bacterium]
MQKYILATLDFFVTPKNYPDPVVYAKARLMAGISIAVLLLESVYWVIEWFWLNGRELFYTSITITRIIHVLAVIIVLWFLKKGKYVASSILLFIFITLLLLLYSVTVPREEALYPIIFMISIPLFSSVFMSLRETVLFHIANCILALIWIPVVLGITYLHAINVLLSVYILGTLIVLLSAYRSYLENISKQQLKISEERSRTLLETTFEAIAVTQNNKILEVNAGFERLVQMGKEQIIGKELSHWLMLSETAGSLVNRVIETSLKQANSVARTVEMAVREQNIENDTVYVVAIRDISDRKRAELLMRQTNEILEERVNQRTLALHSEIEERKRAEHNLEEERASLAKRVEERTVALTLANQELVRAARMKDEFLASMSHELRTPLTGILGLSEALQEGVYGELQPPQMDAMLDVEKSGMHLLTLINDVLDVAKLNAGSLQLEWRNVQIDKVCHEALNLVRPMANEKQMQLQIDLDEQANLCVADERRLKQILLNLLSNAVKFTPKGGKIGLQVVGDIEGQSLQFIVWDTGIGIAPEAQSKLFKPFVQVDSSLAREYEGTGLGLSIVFQLVQLHGGAIALNSELGKGSRFCVTIPWKHVSDLPSPARPIQLASDHTHIHNALIIEDSPIAASRFSRYLEELGLTVTIETHGLNAMKRALDVGADVIILDIILPDVSGWEVLQQLKLDERTKDIPVVIVSQVMDAQKGLQLGAASYLVKPIQRGDLYKAVKAVSQGESVLVVTPNVQESVIADHKNKRILITDDNETTQQMLAEYLRQQGYEVLLANSGYEAFEIAQSTHPDLILMDIQMPGIDGLETTRRLRAISEFAEIPIIALTALVMPGDQDRCIEAGMDYYLSKPIRLQALNAILQDSLREFS